MKALIPAAGIGTRLRPHTLNRPKALLPVAGKPILGHIVDDLIAAGIDGFVIVVGFCGDAVREWFANAYPAVAVEFVEQEHMLGLGHALWTAREAVGDEPFFCILGDTILKADYHSLLGGNENCIAVKSVADPRRFGVVEMNGDAVARFVEKPDVPPSDLAIVGAYLFRDAAMLWRSLDSIVSGDRRTRGEYQLTDALQIMLSEGAPFSIQPVEDWLDCGKKETWLETNRALLDNSPAAAGSGDQPPCHVDPTAGIVESRIGPHVSVGREAVIEGSDLADCIVGAGSRVIGCRLRDSLIGESAVVRGVTGEVNVGDFCEIENSTATE